MLGICKKKKKLSITFQLSNLIFFIEKKYMYNLENTEVSFSKTKRLEIIKNMVCLGADVNSQMLGQYIMPIFCQYIINIVLLLETVNS